MWKTGILTRCYMSCIITNSTMEPFTCKTDTKVVSGASWFDAEGRWPSCHTYPGSESMLNMTAIVMSSRFDAGCTKLGCCYHKYSIKSAMLQWNLIRAQSDCHFTHQRIGPKFVQALEDTLVIHQTVWSCRSTVHQNYLVRFRKALRLCFK